MKIIRSLSLILTISFASGTAPSDTVELKGGHKVTGDVLKADEDAVIVEVGSSVLRVPRSEIERIIRPEDEPPTSPASVPSDTNGPDSAEKRSAGWELFRTADLEAKSIETNARRYGQAVVMVTSPGGQGSGFVITPDGYCITNYHVIAGETRIKVTVFCKTETGYEQKHYKKVKIVALNPFVDLALLKIEEAEAPLVYAYLGDMGECEVGNEVFAIGNPLGLTRTVSQGIISTKNRNFEGRVYIQTTTDINPGNSGGPLFNLKGEVIGVTSMGYLFLGGLNFAIPVDVVKRFIINRDAFAYDEDNPNSGHRYLQPAGRQNRNAPKPGKIPTADPVENPRPTPSK